MKRFILYFVVVCVFIACNDKTEGTIEAKAAETSASHKSDTGTTAMSDTLVEHRAARHLKKTTPLLIARGSEPGWYAEFFADHLRLLIDNGTDSLMVDNIDFSKINADKNFFEMDITHDKNKKWYLSISINGKPCMESGSGEKRERSISITYNKKTYKGCATAQIK